MIYLTDLPVTAMKSSMWFHSFIINKYHMIIMAHTDLVNLFFLMQSVINNLVLLYGNLFGFLPI